MSVRNSIFSDGADRVSGVSRYDLLLAVLPLPLLFGLASGIFSTVPLHYGVSLGSLPSACLLGYAMFYDAPTARE